MKLIALVLLGCLAVSCGAESFLDSDSLTGTNLRVIEIDSFQMNMSTFKYDSIVNDSENRLLIGRYEDPVFGKVRADAFIELVPSTYYLPEGTVFDSIVLNLPYNGYFYNDTLATQRIQVRQLTKTINLPNGVTDYYNTGSFAASDDLIGEKTFRPRISNDSLTIRLSDALGQTLFTSIRSGAVVSNETLRDVFKGIKISPGDTDNAAIMGYNANTMYIRLYYSDDDTDDDSDYKDFMLNSYDDVKKYATRIASDRIGTALSGLTHQNVEMASDAASNRTFIQGGTAVTTKITFPTIRSLSEVNSGNGKIFKANLKLKVATNSFDHNVYAEDSLYVAIVDQHNDILRMLTDESGAKVMAHLEKTNPEYNEIYVTAPVQTFLNMLLENPQYQNYGLILIPLKYNSSVSRLILNGRANNSESKLELTYAIYD